MQHWEPKAEACSLAILFSETFLTDVARIHVHNKYFKTKIRAFWDNYL
jgi:hypothetical protein